MKNGFFSPWLYAFFFFLIPCKVFTQTAGTGPGLTNYFRNPLGIPVSLSANFGELRTNHWHMGLDMRTNRAENYRVYAAAGGYIAFVGVKPLGFGKYVIINHPNGLSSLYAHLNSFSPELEKYVSQKQKEQESWAVELTIPANQFPVKKGDVIAYSGNTGGSMGPHLHFEIRNTATGECLNPLFFDFDVKDDVPPAFTQLAMYDRRVSVYEQLPVLFSVRKTDSGYFANPRHIITDKSKISFAVGAYDRVSGSANPNGIYSAAIYLDEKPMTKFELKNIGYSHTLYMNAHIDYRHKFGGGPYLQHLSKMPGDKSAVYTEINGTGVIELRDTSIHSIKIEAKDIYGNTTKLLFTLQYRYSNKQSLPGSENGTRFIPNSVNIYETSDFQIYTGENCLYDTVRVLYQRENKTPEGAITALHRLNDPSVPVHDPFTIRIKPTTAVPGKFRDKIVIVRTWNSTRSARKATWEGEWITSRKGDFGYYQGFIDSIPPAINDPGKKDKSDTIDLSKIDRIIFTPTDNFGIRSFRAELNGKWLMFSNDKGRSHVYIFDEQCPYGVHELKVKVEDIVGNVTEKIWVFKRYKYSPPPKKKTRAKKK